MVSILKFVDISIGKMTGWWFGAFFPYIGNVVIPTD